MLVLTFRFNCSLTITKTCFMVVQFIILLRKTKPKHNFLLYFFYIIIPAVIKPTYTDSGILRHYTGMTW